MIKLLQTLDSQVYRPRIYFIAETDKFSQQKLQEFEHTKSDFQVTKIPRSREVGQSYVTSVVTTLRSALHCLPHLLEHQPQLLLVNGPGTCLPIAVLCSLLSLTKLAPCRIIFIESQIGRAHV